MNVAAPGLCLDAVPAGQLVGETVGHLGECDDAVRGPGQDPRSRNHHDLIPVIADLTLVMPCDVRMTTRHQGLQAA